MRYIHPRRVYRTFFKTLHNFFFFCLIPDKWEIRYRFKKKLGYSCDLKNPTSFNEKINWLKLHDRNPLYSKITDKIFVKEFVSNLLGPEYVIPLIAGGFSHFDEIPFDILPKQFVLKCNHDSHNTIICLDKDSFDKEFAKNRLERALKKNYYHWIGKEWGYKDIVPQIFVEKYMKDGNHSNLRDYKFFIFNGVVKYIFTFDDRFSSEGVRSNCYDPDWNLLPIVWGRRKNTSTPIEKPDNLAEMISIATKLWSFVNNDFIRVDLYCINGRIFFGEYTLYPGGGMHTFEPIEWDYAFGEQLVLSK